MFSNYFSGSAFIELNVSSPLLDLKEGLGVVDRNKAANDTIIYQLVLSLFY